MKSPLTVTFLGTGTSQGIPVIGSDHPVCKSNNSKDKRLRVSVMIQWDTYTYVIDCGPDFRQQMLREHINAINGILLTHEHSDHTAGLDDIRPFYFKQGDIPFYAHPRVFDALHKRFAYIFEETNKYPGAPTIKEIAITKEAPFKIGGKQVTVIEAQHADLSVLGFRIDGFTYLTDVKTIAKEEMDKIRGTEILVINALRKEKHRAHLNLEEALALAYAIGAKKTYLTHISHLLGFHEEVSISLPDSVYLAYDQLKLTI